jgi:hypothetical protein
MEIFRPIRLATWEEATGKFHKLTYNEVGLLATIGPVVVNLPSDFEEKLRPFVGRKIAILRTDDPARPYRIRQICE